jgi:hypothetical protein
MTQPPDPYPRTREIPRVSPRPAGHLPPNLPATNEAPFVRPVPAARPASPQPAPAPAPAPPDPLNELFSDAYPDPRSKNLLHRYGPQIFIVGAVALLSVLLLILFMRIT